MYIQLVWVVDLLRVESGRSLLTVLDITLCQKSSIMAVTTNTKKQLNRAEAYQLSFPALLDVPLRSLRLISMSGFQLQRYQFKSYSVSRKFTIEDFNSSSSWAISFKAFVPYFFASTKSSRCL